MRSLIISLKLVLDLQHKVFTLRKKNMPESTSKKKCEVGDRRQKVAKLCSLLF